MKRTALAILVFVLCSTSLWAQDTAQVNGTVTDASGAVLPGVEVTATQTATGLVRNVSCEGRTLEFRAEAFKIPNHVNPGLPDTSFSSATFGKILTAGDPRIMQIALKYVF
jgi:hypothetical protein